MRTSVARRSSNSFRFVLLLVLGLSCAMIHSVAAPASTAAPKQETKPTPTPTPTPVGADF